MTKAQGWQGWDDYADFYDWENAQTLDRRDVKFWQGMAERANGPILELGCGTGRVTIPVARTGARIIGVDRSTEMLGHALKRSRRMRSHPRPTWLRGDIRFLPFQSAARFDLVMAPYGILQSLVRESDLKATLASVAVCSRAGASSVSTWSPICRSGRNIATRFVFADCAAAASRALRSSNPCGRIARRS
jgi:SAM-dependent methyltransferase